MTYKQRVEIRAEWPEFGEMTECMTKASGAKGKVPSFHSPLKARAHYVAPCRQISAAFKA